MKNHIFVNLYTPSLVNFLLSALVTEFWCFLIVTSLFSRGNSVTMTICCDSDNTFVTVLTVLFSSTYAVTMTLYVTL
jgi:hypothetical protein